jgi:hypothetical protein
MSFATFEEYEVHYNKTHVNRCIECRKNFPTPHFLNLHQEENHDPLVEVLRERGERTYACFVETCERKCSTPLKRRMHLIDKHVFPKDYDFYIVNDGIDNRSTMLRSGRHRRRSSAAQHKVDIEERARRRTSALGTIKGGREMGKTGAEGEESGESMEEDDDDDDEDDIPAKDKGDRNKKGAERDGDEMNGLTDALSALKFVPPSIRFGRGRGKGRGGFSRT